jgi:hypothetical protein
MNPTLTTAKPCYSSLLLFHESYIVSRLIGDSTVKGGERAKGRRRASVSMSMGDGLHLSGAKTRLTRTYHSDTSLSFSHFTLSLSLRRFTLSISPRRLLSLSPAFYSGSISLRRFTLSISSVLLSLSLRRFTLSISLRRFTLSLS